MAASTIDRRLSTVCGFYRFAHIDGRMRHHRHSDGGSGGGQVPAGDGPVPEEPEGAAIDHDEA